MKWKNEDVEKLFAMADFSAETDLKRRLRQELIPVRRISLQELQDREGLRHGRAVRSPEPARKRERTISQEGKTAEGAINNDRQILPEGHTAMRHS